VKFTGEEVLALKLGSPPYFAAIVYVPGEKNVGLPKGVIV
jgi:hypothetical protein